MKKCIPILLILLLILSGCGKASKKENLSTAEVVINMPADDTVNGYRTNNNENNKTPQSISGADVKVDDFKENKNSLNYCGNKNSKTFHKSSCNSVNTMKESNKYYADRDTLISKGYHPCGKCKP